MPSPSPSGGGVACLRWSYFISSVLLPAKSLNSHHFSIATAKCCLQKRQKSWCHYTAQNGEGHGRGELQLMYFHAKKMISPLPQLALLPRNKKAILLPDSRPYVICFHSSGSTGNPRVKGKLSWKPGVAEGRAGSCVFKACHQPKHSSHKLKAGLPSGLSPRNSQLASLCKVRLPVSPWSAALNNKMGFDPVVFRMTHLNSVPHLHGLQRSFQEEFRRFPGSPVLPGKSPREGRSRCLARWLGRRKVQQPEYSSHYFCFRNCSLLISFFFPNNFTNLDAHLCGREKCNGQK